VVELFVIFYSDTW